MPKSNITVEGARQRLAGGIVAFVLAAGALITGLLMPDGPVVWLLVAAGCLAAFGAFNVYEWKHRW